MKKNTSHNFIAVRQDDGKVEYAPTIERVEIEARKLSREGESDVCTYKLVRGKWEDIATVNAVKGIFYVM